MITKNKEIYEMLAECEKHGMTMHTKQDTGYYFCDECMKTNCDLLYGKLFDEMKKVKNVLKYQFIERT